VTIATGAHWTAASALPAALAEDQRCGLAFYGYPAEHWVHLRTTNPIESAFATVRHRSKITKGPGSRDLDPQVLTIARGWAAPDEHQVPARWIGAPHPRAQ
jgi:putative transposase